MQISVMFPLESRESELLHPQTDCSVSSDLIPPVVSLKLVKAAAGQSPPEDFRLISSKLKVNKEGTVE